MNRNKNILVLISMFIFSLNIYGQGYGEFFKNNTDKIINDSNKYCFNIESSNFLKNNEYFNKFISGYTLIGYWIKPQFVYTPYNNVKLKAGFYALKFFGTNKMTALKPLFSVEYTANKHLKIIFGQIIGGVNHNFPDQVFDYEKSLTQNNENGMQILFKNKIIKSETWVNWKQFIFKNSDYPEKIQGGISNEFSILNNIKNQELLITLSYLLNHTGGQIDTSGVAVETLANAVFGIKYNFINQLKNFRNMGVRIDYILASNPSEIKDFHYSYGQGLLLGLHFNINNFNFKAQYWTAKDYFAKSGSPIYQSVSSFDANFFQENRSLIIGRFFYAKNIHKDFKIGISADSYYDTINKTFDYSYGFYMNINFNILFKN